MRFPRSPASDRCPTPAGPRQVCSRASWPSSPLHQVRTPWLLPGPLLWCALMALGGIGTTTAKTM